MSETAFFDHGERMLKGASVPSHRFRRSALLDPAQSVFAQMAGKGSSNKLTTNLIIDMRRQSPYNFLELLIS
jgi:hypothetical protein